MTVSISGCVLSALLFKLKNVSADAEGFLLGEVYTHRVDNITDSQSSGTKEEKRLCINSYVSFNEKYSFYDRSGALDVTKIEEELGDRLNHLIGWFSYRRNSSHRVSLREKMVHRRLMNYCDAINTKDFLFALITDHLDKATCILMTDYSFYEWVANCPQHMRVEIVNLRASAAVPYQVLPITQNPPSLTHYSTVLDQQRTQFMDKDGNMIQAKAVENLYRALIQTLEPLSKELAHSTEELQQKGAEVSKLRHQVKKLREEQEKLQWMKEPTDTALSMASAGGPADNVPLLIDLESPTEGDKDSKLPPPTDTPISHDLLGTTMEISDNSQQIGDMLQPEVLTNTQSQELF